MKKTGTTKRAGGTAHYFSMPWRKGLTGSQARKQIREHPLPLQAMSQRQKPSHEDVMGLVGELYERYTK